MSQAQYLALLSHSAAVGWAVVTEVWREQTCAKTWEKYLAANEEEEEEEEEEEMEEDGIIFIIICFFVGRRKWGTSCGDSSFLLMVGSFDFPMT